MNYFKQFFYNLEIHEWFILLSIIFLGVFMILGLVI